MTFKKSLKTVFLFSIPYLLLGCSQETSKMLQEKLNNQFDIFSIRPQNVKTVLTTVKLKTPALLATATAVDGKMVVDKDQLAKIEAEQSEAIDQMKKISSDIQIKFKLNRVLNALVIVAPVDAFEKIKQLHSVTLVEKSAVFSRPNFFASPSRALSANDFSNNSVKFIGADQVHKLGFSGQNMRVGIIDTGIDYTHSMLGGSGNPEDYKNMDKSQSSSLFPNKKVVGGYDFVGTKYNAASEDEALQVPTPDVNPMDEGGHGSHVAGSVAGIGDGVNSYSGVAPDAQLYALKVFGAEGSTSDSVVVAAFEYASDPNQDGDLSDRLDVVNLSLGSSYGNPHILYNEAIQNITRGGTVVVASAGNSGAKDYIVGAPGMADDSLCVAASIDDSFANWQFKSVSFSFVNHNPEFAEAIEASTTKPIEEISALEESLVYAALAAEDFSPELKEALKGHVALIDRGGVAFSEKIRRASEAGAVGVVVVNNQPGNAIAMGGNGRFEIPAIMITKDLGQLIRQQMESGKVTINFKSDKRMEKPELIDTLTDFSSKGPRSVDSILKPEITGPGYQIVSAAMGQGTKSVKLSGTSMSSPHLAGVMALMKQAQPKLKVSELKSLVMGTAKTISEKGQIYPLSRQGAGRLQALAAVQSLIASEKPAISLGAVGVLMTKRMPITLPIRNLSDKDIVAKLRWKGSAALSFSSPDKIVLPAHSVIEVALKLLVEASKIQGNAAELDGFLQLFQGDDLLFQWPALAVVQKFSQLSPQSLVVDATNEKDSYGSTAILKIENSSLNSGDVLAFNFLQADDRKKFVDPFTSRECDLQAAGYRIVVRDSEEILQFAIKTYRTMTTWQSCEVSVLIDSDLDGKPDQEIVGVPGSRLAGGTAKDDYVSYLLDATLTRNLRHQFEVQMAEGGAAKEDYSSAILNIGKMTVYDTSSVVIVEAPLKLLKKGREGTIQASIVLAQNESSTVEDDDYLGMSKTKPFNIVSKSLDQPFIGLSDYEKVLGTKEIELTKGGAGNGLLLLFPNNAFLLDQSGFDSQAKVIRAKYKAPTP